MGIFDIFGTSDQRAAAQDQIKGINAGYGQLSDLFGQGRNAVTGYGNAGVDALSQFLNQGRGALTSGVDAGVGALGDLSGQGRNALTGATGAGIGALGDLSNAGRGAFGGAIGAGAGAVGDLYGMGRNATSNLFGQGRDALSSNYAAGLMPFMQNYATAQRGTGALGNALGLNGAGGNADAISAFQNNPGYQFRKQQGDSSILAAQAAGLNGGINSGNTLKALSDYNQGLAGTSWDSYLSNLQPYLGASNSAAGGMLSGFSGLGSGLSGNLSGEAGALNQNLAGQAGATADLSKTLGSGMLGSFGTQAGQTGQVFGNLGSQLLGSYGGQGAQTGQMYGGLGSQLLNSFGGQGNTVNQTYGNIGSQLLGSDMTQGNAGYGANTSIGNANANADLSGLNASGNIMNLLMSLGKMGVSGTGQAGGGGGSLGGNALSGMGSALMGFLSDAKAKEDIEPIGQTFDGQTIHRYRYLGDPRHQIGLIAQEVEEAVPHAVFDIDQDYKGVDYKRATDRAASYGAKILEFTRPDNGRTHGTERGGGLARGLMRFAA